MVTESVARLLGRATEYTCPGWRVGEWRLRSHGWWAGHSYNVSIQLVHLHIDDVKMKDTKTEGMEVDIAETERRRRATWRSQRTRVTGRATTRMMTSSKLTLEIKHLWIVKRQQQPASSSKILCNFRIFVETFIIRHCLVSGLCSPRSAVRREKQTLKLITVIDSYKTVSSQQSAYSLVIWNIIELNKSFWMWKQSLICDSLQNTLNNAEIIHYLNSGTKPENASLGRKMTFEPRNHEIPAFPPLDWTSSFNDRANHVSTM